MQGLPTDQQEIAATLEIVRDGRPGRGWEGGSIGQHEQGCVVKHVTPAELCYIGEDG